MNQYHFAASAMPTGYQFAQFLPVNQILFGTFPRRLIPKR